MASVAEWLGSRFEEVPPLAFYRQVFPAGSLDARGSFTRGRYTAIAVAISDENAVRRFAVCDDLEPIPELLKTEDFVVLSPVAYAGRSMSQRNARELYALAFDLDGLLVEGGRQVGLAHLFVALDKGLLEVPRPTFVVSSGTGVHLYWLLDEPIKLYPNIIKALWKFRISLTNAIWQPDVTSLSAKPQFEAVTQSFRMVGSLAKDKKTRVTAYRTGERLSLATLRDIGKRYPELAIPEKYQSTMSLAEARERYPGWYQDRVVAGKPRGTWTCNRALYDWWKGEIVEGANRFRSRDVGAREGHRYWAIFALAVYARKCDVPREELEKDALSLVPLLDSRTTSEDNHFTASDVMKALEAYDARYITVPRRTIEQLTNIEIPPNKRNGRKQAVHLAICRSTKDVLNKMGEGNAHNAGRPDKKALVTDYYREHPDCSVRGCAKDLDISTTTAQKWLKVLRD